jgi:hypothetical protein
VERADPGAGLTLGQRTYHPRTQLSDDAARSRHQAMVFAATARRRCVVPILLEDGQALRGCIRNLHNVREDEGASGGSLPVLRGRGAGASRNAGRLYCRPALGNRQDARHPRNAEAGRRRPAGGGSRRWHTRIDPAFHRLIPLPAPNPAPQLPSKQLDDAHGRRRRRPGSRRR